MNIEDFKNEVLHFTTTPRVPEAVKTLVKLWGHEGHKISYLRVCDDDVEIEVEWSMMGYRDAATLIVPLWVATADNIEAAFTHWNLLNESDNLSMQIETVKREISRVHTWLNQLEHTHRRNYEKIKTSEWSILHEQ